MTDLVLGSQSLLMPDFNAAGWRVEASSDGTDWGNPDAVIVAIASMLLDGDRSEVSRYSNRTITVQVRVSGTDFDLMSAAEAALQTETNKKRNTLTWSPPGTTVPSVFDIVTAKLDYVRDNDREFGGAFQRVFNLTLTSLPFARRAALTTTVAAPVTAAPTFTLIDDASTLTNWSTYGTPSLISGGFNIVPTYAGPPAALQRARAIRTSIAATSLSAGQFIVFEVEVVGTPIGTLNFYLNGLAVAPAYVENVSGARNRYYLPSPTGSYPYNVNSATAEIFNGNGGQLNVFDLSKSSGPPLAGTGRSRTFSMNMAGTARTEVDLLIEAGGGGNLGDEVLLFSAPQGSAVDPPMRKYLTAPAAGSITNDATTVSGKRNAYNGTVFTIAATLVPEGTHLVMARVRMSTGTASPNLAWTGWMTGTWYSTVNDQTGSADVALTTTWVNVILGLVELPAARVSDTSTSNITLSLATGTANVEVDELWLFNLDYGVLSQVTAKVGASTSTRLLAASATVDRPRPAWYLGTAGSATADVDVTSRMPSVGRHVLPPGLSLIHVVTPGATSQTVTGTCYERFHTHVPKVS